MPVFAVMLRGENFVIQVDGVPERMGFYTTRFVHARNEEEAETRAVQMVRESKSLRSAGIKSSSFTPMIYLESIERRPWWYKFKTQHGFVFWNMDLEAAGETSNNTIRRL
jgi:hypothetical protein